MLSSLLALSCAGGESTSSGNEVGSASGGTGDLDSTGGAGTGGEPVTGGTGSGVASGGAEAGGTGSGASTGGAETGSGTGGERADLGEVQYCAFKENCWEFVSHSPICQVTDEKNCYSFGGEHYAAGECPDKFSVLAAEDNTGCGLTLTRELP